MASVHEKIEKVREAIKKVRGDGVATRFSEEHLKKLYDEGYTEPEDLLSISRESLIEMGLPKARVDALISKPAAGAPQPAQQLQLPEELLAFLRRAVQQETSLEFADEISVGGSKMDLSEAREALVRLGFERVETIVGVADSASDANSGTRFEWTEAREDDSSNMSRAQEFVRAGLAAHMEGFTVVDVSQRNIFSRIDATPRKRMKLRDTRTDLAVVMTEFAELAKLNPRNYLAQTAGIVDTKTETAWKRSHDDFRGQGLGQFAGCTLLSLRKGVGMPVLLTNLVGDSHVFHGVPKEGEGGGLVREVIFSDQAAAFKYFGKVCNQAEVVLRKKVADLLAAYDTPPAQLPAAQPSLPSRNPLIDSPPSPGPVDSDLMECTYREVRREQPLFNLPPFEAMMEYWSNLEQGLVRAAEVRSCPSYII